jgi:Histidine kinase-, DNA gyrase B-, and HSP90-like ATPase
MNWYSRLSQSIRQVSKKIDPASLEVRLTLSVATVSASGLAGVAIWMSVAMQSILVATHKQNLKYIGDRFPQDVKIYSDMVSMDAGIQKTIDNLTTDNTLLWVKNGQGQIIAKSSSIDIGSRDRTLSSLLVIPYNPELQKVNERYWLLCKNALVVKGVDLGQVYIAQDITSDQIMLTIQLLQDLLELERVDSGGMYFDFQPIILNEFIEEVVKTARECSDRQIQFNSFPNPIVIKADPNRLKQVLLNLIDNAVNYSERDPITYTMNSQKMQAIIQVSDRGIGIPLAQQIRIFDRFYRVDETRSRTTGGTGLGLSIVKTLVEGMGGNISVYSQLGKGSTFTVNFPLLRSPS